MINPNLIDTVIWGMPITITWYAVIIFIDVWLFFLLTIQESKFKGQDTNTTWDYLLYGFVGGFIMARVYFVVNDIAGGDLYYIQNPAKIIAYWEGGWHIFGVLLGVILGVGIYAYQHKLSWPMILDTMAPATLVVQGLGRFANLVSQTLYGPPTTLPWGIPIDAQHRIAQWKDLSLFPVETTRFHPTFAYDMLWHLLAAALLYWITRRYKNSLKTGMTTSIFLILAGLGRFIIEAWRPDQPILFEPAITTTRLVSATMVLIGIIWFWIIQSKSDTKRLRNL